MIVLNVALHAPIVLALNLYCGRAQAAFHLALVNHLEVIVDERLFGIRGRNNWKIVLFRVVDDSPTFGRSHFNKKSYRMASC